MDTDTRSWAKRKWTDFEGFVEGVIYDRDLSVSARLFGLFLHPFSYLFSGIVRLRLFLYSKRIFFRDKPLDCLILVVGNLTVGGTGKTPVVERFTKELLAKGKKVAILSRGYKSKEEAKHSFWNRIWKKDESPPKIVSDGKRVLLDSEEAGDEPFMLATNLPGAIVLADKDRVKAGRYAIDNFGADALILDDGFLIEETDIILIVYLHHDTSSGDSFEIKVTLGVCHCLTVEFGKANEKSGEDFSCAPLDEGATEATIRAVHGGGI